MTNVIASLATILGREEAVRAAVESLVSQVDVIRVAFDGFHEIPRWVDSYINDGVRVEPVVYNPRVGDGAKFSSIRPRPGDLHLVCDDDIVYPSDYAARLKEALVAHPGAVVGVHGAQILPSCRTYGYHAARRVYHCTAALARPTPVNVLGTGTLAFFGDRIRIVHGLFRCYPNAADLVFARMALEQNVPLIAIPRDAGWIKVSPVPAGETIYEASMDRTGSFLDSRDTVDAIARCTRWD